MKNDGYAGRLGQEHRLNQLRGEGTDSELTIAEDLDDELQDSPSAFSVRSADRHQKVMLEFRFKDANAKALAYSYLVRIDFNPSEGIKMDFGGQEVRLSGRNLRPLFAGLVNQRVASVQETDLLHAEATAAKDDTVVTKIEIAEVK